MRCIAHVRAHVNKSSKGRASIGKPRTNKRTTVVTGISDPSIYQ